MKAPIIDLWRQRMRSTTKLLSGLAAAGLLLSGFNMPAQAAPKKFEAKLAFPGADGGLAIREKTACPAAGQGDGTFYKFFDLKGDFTHFKVEGPKRLVTDPSGTTKLGDYDIDMYVYDAKCKEMGAHNTEAGVEAHSTKKPARYVVVHYYTGVHANLPITLQVANEKIK